MKIKLNDNLIRFLYKFVDVESSGEAGVPHERMHEYGYALASILRTDDKFRKILDVGCVARMNTLISTLCELGYTVYGIDGRMFKYNHPNFKFTIDDIREVKFPSNYFDIVTIISTIEHIGLSGRYNILENDVHGDRRAIKEIKRILKVGGNLILTTEIGDPKKSTKLARIYKRDCLLAMLNSFDITDKKFYAKVSGVWQEQLTPIHEGLICINAKLVSK